MPISDGPASINRIHPSGPSYNSLPGGYSTQFSEDAARWKSVADSTIDQFAMPHRSVSNVTVVPSMQLSWHNLSAFVSDSGGGGSFFDCCFEPDVEASKKQQKQVLNGVFGSANPGEILAIMGASGAGKTSLLNILTQRNVGALTVDGSVKVNGLRVDKQYMKKVSAYVQQDDCFIGSLTVEEHLLFTARLKMSDRYSIADQQRRVRQVIGDLGLRGSADTLIGTRTRKGLSGGEKKRLSFASEILTSPPILLCDEPTSGLDSFLAFQVVSVLKRLALKKGMTVVLTIHQPSSQVFELFDRIYLMAEGRVAFCGSQPEAVAMWNHLGSPLPLNFNPADHYISTLAVTQKNTQTQRDKVMAVCDYFANSPAGKAMWIESRSTDSASRDSSVSIGQWPGRHKETHQHQYNAGWFLQLTMLIWRNTKTTMREPTLLKVQIMQSIIIAVLTGIIYLQNTPSQKQIMNINGALFQMVSEMAFMFQFSAVNNFCFEFPTFYREHGSNLYRISSYFVAKNLAELPAYTLSACVFSAVLYWMSGLVPLWDAFLIYTLTAVLVQNVAISIGYAVGCIFGTVSTAVAVLPVFVVPMIAFGGFFINVATLPWYFYPIKYLSHLGYAFEIAVINEWQHVDNIPGCEKPTGCFKNGTDVIASLSFKEDNLWTNVGLLVAMLVGIRIIGFIGLYTRTKMRK